MTNPEMAILIHARRLTLVAGLALALFATPPVLARAGADDDAAPGRLSVSTDPVGASVYVDGRLAGRTPLALDQLSAGEHRVRIQQPGYLENARVIAIESGKVTTVSARLTPGTTRGTPVTREAGAARDADAAVDAQGGQGGSGSKKWLWIAVAGGGAAAAVFALKDRNAAPTVTGAAATPSTAISGMNVSFSAQGAADPDGDALTYDWDIGDGSTGTGSTATHGYGAAGTFNVTLTVGDGKKSASTSTSVTIKTATARWVGTYVIPGFGTCSTTVNLTQAFSSLTGNYVDCLTGALTGGISGSIDTAGLVTMTITVPGFAPFTFRGNPSADVNTLTGVINGSGFVNTAWVMTRQ